MRERKWKRCNGLINSELIRNVIVILKKKIVIEIKSLINVELHILY